MAAELSLRERFDLTGVVSPQDFVDSSEGKMMGTSLPEIHKRFGDQYFFAMHARCKLEKVRDARKTVTDQIRFSDATTGNLVCDSVVLKFQIGACGEFSAQAWIKSPGSFRVTIAQSADLCNPGQTHSFLIAGVSEKILKQQVKNGQNFESILKLKQGQVIDPYFDFECPVSQLQQRGVKMLKYQKLWGLDTVLMVECNRHTEEVYAPFIKQVYERTAQVYRTMAEPEGNLPYLQFFREAAPAVSARQVQVLSELFPKRTWTNATKKDSTTIMITTKGTEKEIDTCCNGLLALGVRKSELVKSKGTLLLNNAFLPPQLYTFVALQNIFNGATSSFTSRITSYL